MRYAVRCDVVSLKAKSYSAVRSVNSTNSHRTRRKKHIVKSLGVTSIKKRKKERKRHDENDSHALHKHSHRCKLHFEFYNYFQIVLVFETRTWLLQFHRQHYVVQQVGNQ